MERNNGNDILDRKLMEKRKPEELLRHILRDIEPAEAPNGEVHVGLARVEGAAQRLPLPYMVFSSLVLGAGCNYEFRPHEKTAWAINLRYKDVPVRLEHGKFGMRMETVHPSPKGLVDDFIATLKRAFPVADRLLQPHVDAQIRRGNVTISNRFHRLDGRYRFHRRRAELAYARQQKHEERVAKKFVRDLRAASAKGKRNGFVGRYDPAKPEREGFYYGSAAIDAYFSRLEHLFVLVLPFVDFDPRRDNLLAFIGLGWGEKMKRVFNFTADLEAQRLYGQLRNVKERYRNPISHGEFEKGGASLYVHFGALGAIPMRLSRFEENIDYNLFPVTEISFQDACGVFDAADRYLEKGAARFGYEWVMAGLDVAFDKESIRAYRAAMASADDFNAFIETRPYVESRERDMDW